METTTKVKFKVGVHEFEAEGPADVVREQLEAFKQLIAELPAAVVKPAPAPRPMNIQELMGRSGADDDIETDTTDGLQVDQSLNKIMRVEQRVVSLTVSTASLGDAVLLIVYGQKILRDNDAVTGSEVMDGLTATGQRVERVDRVLAKAGDTGDVIVIGVGRAKRYRLTNMGLQKARQLAGRLIGTVA